MAVGCRRGPEKRSVLGICALGSGGGKSQTWSLVSANPFIQDPALSNLSLFSPGLRPGSSFPSARRINSSPVPAELWLLTSKPIFWTQLQLACAPSAPGNGTCRKAGSASLTNPAGFRMGRSPSVQPSAARGGRDEVPHPSLMLAV